MAAPPIRVEIAATILFAAAGLAGYVLTPAAPMLVWANAFFYAVLLVNTYFSIRFFGSLPPEGRDERVVDGALVAIYVALGLSIGRVLLFTFLTALLFAVAIVKYHLLKDKLTRRDLIDRKIAIDAAGLLLCTLAFIGAALGFAEASAWTQAIVFAAANVYLLTIRPMYAL